MTLEEIITLFEEVESGKTGQRIGLHLHRGITCANEGSKIDSWLTNERYSNSFSGFLKALKDHPKPNE